MNDSHTSKLHENHKVSVLDKDNSLLLVIDVQEKLTPAIAEIDSLLARLGILVRGAQVMDIPVMITEHCPDKIGHTVKSLRLSAPNARYVSKTYFGASRESYFRDILNSSGRRQIVVTGMEAHVCVMQTTLGLLQQGYEVFLVIDGIGSRNSHDRETGIDRLSAAGAIPVTAEMVLFEWLEHAGAQCFHPVLDLIKIMVK